MVAGLLSDAGYFQGDNLYDARDANPKGFFEDPEINAINEDLIALATRQNAPAHSTRRSRRLAAGQLWLAELPSPIQIQPDALLARRIAAISARSPFAIKDPRFCFTLPAWRCSVSHAAIICVFRHPAVTATSTITECKSNPYLRSVRMGARRAESIWISMYDSALRLYKESIQPWLFVHYDQVLSGDRLGDLSTFVNAPLTEEFVDLNLKRSSSKARASSRALSIYRQLCLLADASDVD